MKISKPKIVATTVVLGIAGLAGAGFLANQVFAATSTTTSSTLVQKIATTFNLDAAAVAKVFQQDRLDHQETRLAQLVTDGKITEAQKALIEAKEADNQTKEDTIRNDTTLTDAQKRTQLMQIRTDMQQWLTNNGISNIPGLMGGPGGHGHEGPAHMDGDETTSTSQ